MENRFIRADDVAQELSVSKPYAYKLIRKLNEELKAKGFITIAGRVNRQYFYERLYGAGKSRIVEPLIKRLKALVKTVLVRCFQAIDDYHRLNVTNANLYRENERLSKVNEKLADENENLLAENKDYKLLRKVFGNKQIDSLLEQARQSKQRDIRFRNTKFER